MKVSVTYTLNELQRITPNLRKEHFKSDNPKVKEALKELFWNLGCTLPDKVEIDEGLVTLNRFGNVDESARVIVNERLDEVWVESKYASEFAKLYTKDVGVMNDIDRLRNRRSYDNDVE